MITTSTGAKKLESSDNWREIFPNPGTSAAGAHNASVDAQDRIQAEVAPIINGKRCSLGAASGEYVLLRNSTITGKTDGAYQAAKAIPANTDLDSTYLGSPITGGLVNELNSNITPQVVSGATIVSAYSSESALTVYRVGNIVVVGGYISGSIPAGTEVITGLPVPVSIAYRFYCKGNASLYFNGFINALRTDGAVENPSFAFAYVTSE